MVHRLTTHNEQDLLATTFADDFGTQYHLIAGKLPCGGWNRVAWRAGDLGPTIRHSRAGRQGGASTPCPAGPAGEGARARR
jgi:hypothetical protein